MKKSLALIIGNADYNDRKRNLVNAINDANAIAEKLRTVGFDVIQQNDCDGKAFEQAVADFGTRLADYDVGLFYFSGHGLQIEGVNYLTYASTNFFDDTAVPGTSYRLDRVIKYMERTEAVIKILILDACRDNPLENRYRGAQATGLAPIYAPKGTIIAFSTSPGESAQDYGMGNNSIYTGSLLRHIDDPNIPIEEVFKRVRTSVYSLTQGKQTSWEHTSLIGDYYFNFGQRVVSLQLPYKPHSVADGKYIADDSTFGKIISGLRSHTWETQRQAMASITRTSARELDDDSLFILGRNILQTAEGGCFNAEDFIRRLPDSLSMFGSFRGVHLINGMLFEVYFDKTGAFREEQLKSEWLQELLKLESHSQFRSSFDLIWANLRGCDDTLFYIPGSNAMPVAVEATFQKSVESNYFSDEPSAKDSYKLSSLKFQDNELLIEHGIIKVPIQFKDLPQTVAIWLSVPESKITVSTSMPLQPTDEVWVPRGLRLSKKVKPQDEDDLF
ncbi:caspase family protein [Dyadobacter subterraneus]|uniref:Caspase family protein n=1 Tax=Dyadobacter subterraneus TaxID=2773304 RepID=A0ABR9WC27_9BACT|nr:caspase family protein [Dyadobacter subterraneus]MBE9461916.1 caspase family protein [Dyadobacter subterraneus]